MEATRQAVVDERGFEDLLKRRVDVQRRGAGLRHGSRSSGRISAVRSHVSAVIPAESKLLTPRCQRTCWRQGSGESERRRREREREREGEDTETGDRNARCASRVAQSGGRGSARLAASA